MEAKFGPPEKKKHDWIGRYEIFQKSSGYTLFDHERNGEILDEMKEPVDLKKNQIKLVTTLNKTEQ